MTWLQHPRFIPVRDRALEAVKRTTYRFHRTNPVIFLCGGYQSKRRDRVAEYLRSRPDKNYLVFYAEQVWTVIAKEESLNALDMEKRLAELSDIVVVIVESPGTFAELGAFSLSPDLRKKLFPILSAELSGQKSFIETGPVSWVDSESLFKPSIWVDFGSILGAADQLDERLSRISSTPSEETDLVDSPKHLLFFVCDLVSIFGPCPADHIEFYLSRTLDLKSPSNATMLLGLAVAMDLIVSFVGKNQSEMYAPKMENGKLKSFHYKKKSIRSTHFEQSY